MPALLSIAEWWCGRNTASLVFEPLLADWQHQLDAARTRGRDQYAAALVSGAFAFIRSLARCTMTGRGWLPTSRAAQIVSLTFVFTAGVALFLLWIASLPSGITSDPGSIATQAFLLSAASLAVAPVLLPALFLMRRDARSTPRHAIAAIACLAAIVAGVITLTSEDKVRGYFSTFASFEREYHRNLANDRDGRVTYPGTAVRQLRGPRTLEQRRADYQRGARWRAEQESKQPPLTLAQRLRRMQPVVLAILFGIMGWTLAGLGPPTFARAAMWWLFVYAASLAFGVMPRALTGLPIRGVPYDYAVPMFGTATLALAIASWCTKERRV